MFKQPEARERKKTLHHSHGCLVQAYMLSSVTMKKKERRPEAPLPQTSVVMMESVDDSFPLFLLPPKGWGYDGYQGQKKYLHTQFPFVQHRP